MIRYLGCLVFIATIQYLNAENITDERIVGGTAANIRRFPWQVAVLTPQKLCGGSLIRVRWVVTSGRCVYGLTASDVIIRAGSPYFYKGGILKEIKTVVIHRRYSPQNFNNDIAMLRIKKKFRPKQQNEFGIRIIPLGKYFPATGKYVYITGYGLTAFGIAQQLRKARLRIIDKQECEKIYNGQLTNSMQCAGVTVGRKGFCKGDHGGPMIRNNRLMGIISWSKGCASTFYPGVYTSVPFWRRWILWVINN